MWVHSRHLQNVEWIPECEPLSECISVREDFKVYFGSGVWKLSDDIIGGDSEEKSADTNFVLMRPL